MTPVLIYTDTDTIDDEQETLANIVPVYQAIYTAVKGAGVASPTLAEIDGLVQNARKQSQTTFVNDYVLNKLVAAVSPFIVNGVTLTTAAVKGFISMPDTSAITAALQPVWGHNSQSVFSGKARAARLNLLSLTDDVISAVEDADTQITALFTYYTVSDASATLATQLLAVCTSLNAFDTANAGIYLKRIPTGNRNDQGDLETEIPGVAVSRENNNYILSLSFIRKFEQTGTVWF